MTDLDLNAIQARADAATPGPWLIADTTDPTSDWYDEFDGPMVVDDDSRPGFYSAIAKDFCQGADDGVSDAVFVAHARTDVPALLAEVRHLRAAVARAEQDRDRAAMQRDNAEAAVEALTEERDRLADEAAWQSGDEPKINLAHPAIVALLRVLNIDGEGDYGLDVIDRWQQALAADIPAAAAVRVDPTMPPGEILFVGVDPETGQPSAAYSAKLTGTAPTVHPTTHADRGSTTAWDPANGPIQRDQCLNCGQPIYRILGAGRKWTHDSGLNFITGCAAPAAPTPEEEA